VGSAPRFNRIHRIHIQSDFVVQSNNFVQCDREEYSLF